MLFLYYIDIFQCNSQVFQNKLSSYLFFYLLFEGTTHCKYIQASGAKTIVATLCRVACLDSGQ